MRNVVLSVLAHPDDAEFLCAGALIRLVQEHGWEAHIASMTPGDCGSAELGSEEISRIRRLEGASAAAVIGATYHCLEERDLHIFYSEQTLAKVARLLRDVQPAVVLTHSPADYMLDHEITSQIVRASAFNAPIPNYLAGDRLPPLEQIPHLYYCDPIEGKDALGRPLPPAFGVDISQALPTKERMLACHASQREWLLKHHGMDQYLQAMRDWARHRGELCGVAAAEGFRQHLGHGYPQGNLLGETLGSLLPNPPAR